MVDSNGAESVTSASYWQLSSAERNCADAGQRSGAPGQRPAAALPPGGQPSKASARRFIADGDDDVLEIYPALQSHVRERVAK